MISLIRCRHNSPVLLLQDLIISLINTNFPVDIFYQCILRNTFFNSHLLDYSLQPTYLSALTELGYSTQTTPNKPKQKHHKYVSLKNTLNPKYLFQLKALKTRKAYTKQLFPTSSVSSYIRIHLSFSISKLIFKHSVPKSATKISHQFIRSVLELVPGQKCQFRERVRVLLSLNVWEGAALSHFTVVQSINYGVRKIAHSCH